MTPELRARLEDRYPWLPQWRDPEREPPWRHLEVEDGWFDLLNDLCRELEAAAVEHGVRDRLRAGVIRQKWARLDFGFPHLHPSLVEIVQKYENLSTVTCELCGRRGEQRWLDDCGAVVACPDCFETWQEFARARAAEDLLEEEKEREAPGTVRRLLEAVVESPAIAELRNATSLEGKVRVLMAWVGTGSPVELDSAFLTYILRKTVGLSRRDRLVLHDWYLSGQLARWQQETPDARAK